LYNRYNYIIIENLRAYRRMGVVAMSVIQATGVVEIGRIAV
jgi:hypothetical protein